MNSSAPSFSDRLAIATHWCMRVSERSLRPHESTELQTWLESDALNRKAFEGVIHTWQSVDSLAISTEMIAVRRAALAEGPRARRWRAARLLFTPSKAAAVAATLLVALGSAGVWWMLRPMVLSTDIGERRVAALSDGSRVSLDAASKVTLLFTQEQRRVRLETGRAKFDVFKDASRPFAVEAGGKLVVATGTSFSVEVLQSEVRVVLYEGHVTVVDQVRPEGVLPNLARSELRPAVPREHLLEPGKVLVETDDAAPVELVNSDTARSLSWEGGMVAFDDEPLRSAVERMNRYTDRKIEIVDPGVGALKISGLFAAGDVESLVDGLTGALPVRAVRKDGHINLVATPRVDDKKDSSRK